MITPPDRRSTSLDDPENALESVLPDWVDAGDEEPRFEDSL